MPTPQGPTGELIGQQITLGCDVPSGDYYAGQLPADLTTEYDLTKGVNITFDGQLYKNVPVHYVENDSFLIGEFIEQQPILNKYPFFIVLGIDTPLETSIHIVGLVCYAKTEGEHTFTVSEGSGSERVMKLSGASRTYSHTAEPRFVKKANKTDELPPVSAADAGKLLGVDEEGNITLVESGGGGGGYSNIDILYAELSGSTVTISKSFNDILSSADNNAVILVLQDGDSANVFNLIQVDGNVISFEYDNNQLQPDDGIVIFSKMYISIYPDNRTEFSIDGIYKVSVTPYTP